MQTEQSHQSGRTGYVLVALAALGFALKAIFIRLALADGTEPLTLLLMRMYCATPVLLGAYVWHRAFSRPVEAGTPDNLPGLPGRLRTVLRYGFLAIVGAGGAMYFSFRSIALTGAAVATIIVYTYPSMTILILAARRRRLPRRQALAAAVTLAGLIPLLVFDKNAAGTAIDLAGILYGLLSALCFAAYNVVVEGELKRTDPIPIAVRVLLTLTLIGALAFGVREYPTSLRAWTLAALLGVVAGFVPYLLFLHGMRRIGAGPTGVVNSIGPVLTIVLAAIFLDEELTVLQILGAGIVLVGVLSLKVDFRAPLQGMVLVLKKRLRILVPASRTERL